MSASLTPVPAEAFVGCLLGTAVGDALGLPYEGLSPRRAERMFPDRERHHLLPGKGMISDDTEHACFVAQALIGGRGSLDAFERRLGWSLRWWFLGLPAGIGLATLRSIVKLWLGFPPRSSGVFSAGNGPAMRSPLLGLAFGHDRGELCRYVRASTRITHSDPKAYYGALAVALASYWSATREALNSVDFRAELAELLVDEPAEAFLELLAQAEVSAQSNQSVAEFAAQIGSRNGVSGYIYHTVPCVMQVWFRHVGDYRAGILEMIAGGGDADTTAAILGGILGARAGREGIPAAWREHIIEWPRSMAWMERLADALALQMGDPTGARKPPGYFVPGLAVRNLVFMLVVLAHGFRRLAPPY